MTEVFSNKEDIAKKYADKRKGISAEEVEDVMDCIFGYLKQTTSDKETYAVRLGELGFIHRNFKIERKKNKDLKITSSHELIDKMIVELAINNDNRLNPLARKSYLDKQYPKLSIEDIQDIQNYGDED